MPKKVKTIIKLNLPAGEATPAPPVGPALGQHGLPIMEFVKAYNERTANQVGQIVPVEITIFTDRTFRFELKTPPAAALLKAAAGIEKASKDAKREVAGTISREDLRRIAQTKLPDLNTDNIDQAMRIIAGTARNMGIAIRD